MIQGTFSLVVLGSCILVLNACQILSLVVRLFSSRAFYWLNRTFAGWFWGLCVFFMERIWRVEILQSGDPIPPGEKVILFCNHQQMPDVLALMPLAKKKQRLPDLKWFVKDPIKWVPGVGWGMLFLDCIFLKRDWTRDAQRVQKTFANLVGHGLPFWLISFSEGTRITPEKLQKSQDYSKRNQLPVFQNVLFPRTKGFTASVTALRENIDAIYDVTLRYEPKIPTLWQFIKGEVPRVHLLVRRFPVATLPRSEAGLSDWLIERFAEKDRVLGA